MSEQRDPRLQALFDAGVQDLDGAAFTERVMARTRRRRHHLEAAGLAAGLALVVAAWLFTAPMLGFAQLVTETFATTLVDLGDGWLAWIFAPVNNLAGLLVLSVKALRMAWKRMLRSSRAY